MLLGWRHLAPELARQTPSKSATNTSDGYGMSFNFAQLFDGLSRAIFRAGQSLFIVSIENAFISFVAYVHGYLCDRMPQNQAFIRPLFAAAIRLPIRCSQDAHNAMLRSRKKDSTPLLLALMGLSLDNSIGVKSRRW